jgi:hypothetical protein
VFTVDNWDMSQTVTVTGVDDGDIDGNVNYSIVTAAATSTDSFYNGINADDVSVTNTDNDAVEATSVSVDSISYATQGGRGGTKNLSVTLALKDDLGAASSGATVSIELHHTDSGTKWTGSGTTDSTGQVRFNLKNAPSGSYITTVTNVDSGSLNWDHVTPANSFTKGGAGLSFHAITAEETTFETDTPAAETTSTDIVHIPLPTTYFDASSSSAVLGDDDSTTVVQRRVDMSTTTYVSVTGDVQDDDEFAL